MNAELATRVEQMPTENIAPHDPMISMIERIAMDPQSDLAKLEKMLDMKERHETAQAKAAFASAFACASAQFPTIPLNGKGHNNKPYATLKDIISHTRPILSENGLALTFAIDTSGNKIVVTAKLMHKDGHSESTSIDLPADNSGSKNAVQAVGSTQTYGQRYTAQAILGLSLGDDTDDDGQAAGRGETITESQYRELRDMIERAGLPAEVVCKAERITDLTDLPAASFAKVKNNLEINIKRREEANG